MIRKGFLMHVQPDAHEEYERRHREVWEELSATLKAHGVWNYSIYLDAKRNLLFGYVEIEDEARWKAISATPICQKWWAYLKEIMPSNPDNSPISEPLREVFHLD
jgi:L-rhamnose mutarotase